MGFNIGFRQLLSARLSELETKLLADFDNCVVNDSVLKEVCKDELLESEVESEGRLEVPCSILTSSDNVAVHAVPARLNAPESDPSEECEGKQVPRSILRASQDYAAPARLNAPDSDPSEECDGVQVTAPLRQLDDDEAEQPKSIDKDLSLVRGGRKPTRLSCDSIAMRTVDGESGPFVTLPAWQERSSLPLMSFRETFRENSRKSLSHMSSTKFSLLAQSRPHSMHFLEEYMIDPSSMKNISKELVGLLFIMYDFFVIPLTVFDPLETPLVICASWLTRLFWSVDIILSLVTGHITGEGVAEIRPNEVLRHYARTWLFFDLICVLADWTSAFVNLGQRSMPDDGWSASQSIGKSARLLRVLRVFKSLQIGSYIWEHVRSEELRLVSNILGSIVVMLALAHVVACAWYMLATSQDGAANWLESHDIEGVAVSVQYTWSLHWSVAQFSGEQIFAPASHRERIFALIVLLLFFLVAAMFVSHITTSMTRLQIITSKEASQFAALRCYLADNQISRKLSVRIQRNARHAFAEGNRNTLESNVELLSLISGPLHAELHFEVHSPVLLRHPFFLAFCDHKLAAVQKISHIAVSPRSVSQGDVLFSENETPVQPRMLFVVHGTVDYISHRSTSKRMASMVQRTGSARPTSEMMPPMHDTLGAGKWVCEGVLWTRWKHCGKLTAKSDCRLLELDATAFAQVCETFPSEHPGLYAEEFVGCLNDAFMNSLSVTDLPLPDIQLGRIVQKAFPEPDDDEVSLTDARISACNRRGHRMSVTSRRSSLGSRLSLRGAWNGMGTGSETAQARRSRRFSFFAESVAPVYRGSRTNQSLA